MIKSLCLVYLFFPIRDQRLWRILWETFLLKWAWLEHWIVSRLNGKDRTLWWQMKKFFFSCNSTWPLLNYKVHLVHVCWWRSCTMCVLSVCTDSSFLLIIKCTKMHKNYFGPTEQRSTFCPFWATFFNYFFTLFIIFLQ